MNITEKIIITDTNIITDLDNAKLLSKFVLLENVYISDLVKNDEMNFKTGDFSLINKFKTIESSGEEMKEVLVLSKMYKNLSRYDLINYVIAKNNYYILATGDNALKKFAESNCIEVIRTLKIIELMKINNIIKTIELVNACNLLINSKTTRIPKEEIENLKNKYETDLVFN